MSTIILSIVIYLIFGVGVAKLDASTNSLSGFSPFVMFFWPIALILSAFDIYDY